jgi:hypothetical protein
MLRDVMQHEMWGRMRASLLAQWSLYHGNIDNMTTQEALLDPPYQKEEKYS